MFFKRKPRESRFLGVLLLVAATTLFVGYMYMNKSKNNTPSLKTPRRAFNRVVKKQPFSRQKPGWERVQLKPPTFEVKKNSFVPEAKLVIDDEKKKETPKSKPSWEQFKKPPQGKSSSEQLPPPVFNDLAQKPKEETREERLLRIAEESEAKDISKESVPESERAEQWIILTSVQAPTEDVKFLANIPGWKVVVVGDTKTPKDWSYPNCVFLSVEKQVELGYATTKHIGFKLYTRKNIGYLYAIQHGAKVVYETDDDNRPTDRLAGFHRVKRMSGLMFDGSDLFNAYHHFGQSTLWGRGYPLERINDPYQRKYRLGNDWETPLIQQGIVNGDPDMDALFRLTRKTPNEKLNVTFDPMAPPAILPEGVFSPYNSQNTFFHYEALWSLMLSTTTTFRVCDIWRGYWTQRLLWEIGGRLGFVTANAYQVRNAHSYLKDSIEEEHMYHETDRLLTSISQWTCPDDLSFFRCVELLSDHMVKEGLWFQADGEMTKSWISDLTRIGYPEPARVKRTSWRKCRYGTNDAGPSEKKDGERHLKQCNRGYSKASFVSFYPAEGELPLVKRATERHDSEAEKQLALNAGICGRRTSFQKGQVDLLKSGISSFFSDILVVVVFKSSDHYSNIRFLEAAYHVVFPNIAFCGQNPQEFEMETNKLGRSYTFIDADTKDSKANYKCLVKAIEMQYKVSGYFVISDDSLISPWTLTKFDKSKVWAPKKNLTTIDWKEQQRMGQNSFERIIEDLRDQKSFPVGVRPVDEYLKMLEKSTEKQRTLPSGRYEVYYVPARLQNDVKFYLSFYAKNNLNADIAVPTALYGLEDYDKVSDLLGKPMGPNMQSQSLRNVFSLGHNFIYPFRFQEQGSRSGFCDTYLPIHMARIYGWPMPEAVTQDLNDSRFTRRSYQKSQPSRYLEKQPDTQGFGRNANQPQPIRYAKEPIEDGRADDPVVYAGRGIGQGQQGSLNRFQQQPQAFSSQRQPVPEKISRQGTPMRNRVYERRVGVGE